MWLHLRVEPNNSGAEILREGLGVYFLMQCCLLAPVLCCSKCWEGRDCALGRSNSEGVGREFREREREIGWREFIHNTKHKVGFVLKKAMPPSLTVSKQKC